MTDRVNHRSLLPGFFCLCALAGAADPVALAPASDWVLPVFTRENHRSLIVRGARATFPSARQADVVDLNLTVFAGDATNHIETILLSPAATFHPQESRADGTAGVRLIRDDLEATGDDWTYLHAQIKVSLHGSVRVIFNAELKHLLK